MPKGNSQFRQDDWVIDFHNGKRDGTYLEIGVHDGETDNNTFRLDKDYGWKGVCIDPFMQNMEKRSCQQLHIALGPRNDNVEFVKEGGHSGVHEYVTSDIHNAKNAHRLRDTKTVTVEMQTPARALEQTTLPNVIDYMSLDVEGAELDVMKNFPFEKYCVRYATIETNNDSSRERELTATMEAHGYTFVKHEGVDHVFSHDCSKYNITHAPHALDNQ